MAEWKLQDGDYVPDGMGSLCRVSGGEEVLQWVRFQLVMPQGKFPFLPQMGSELAKILREKSGTRQVLAQQYVTQALAQLSDLSVETVTLQELGEGRVEILVALTWNGSPLTINLEV